MDILPQWESYPRASVWRCPETSGYPEDGRQHKGAVGGAEMFSLRWRAVVALFMPVVMSTVHVIRNIAAFLPNGLGF